MGWDGPVTYRQYMAWNAWFDMQWHRLTPTLHYLIQLAVEVRRSYVKKPKLVKPAHLTIKWKERKAAKKRMTLPTKEEIDRSVKAAQARWFSVAGPPVKVIYRQKEEPQQESDTDPFSNLDIPPANLDIP